MPINQKRIIYFNPQIDGTAEHIRTRRPDIAVHRADPGKDEAVNWAEFSVSHGYHVAARTELQQPWFPDAKLIARAPNLLAVCSLGAGYDVIDVDACTDAGIIVCNQSGANKEAVAEHTLGFMLNLSKQIMKTDRLMRRSGQIDRFEHLGNDVFGKTVGIVGLGNIGSRVAELCRGLLQMTVLAYDPYLTEHQVAMRGARKIELADLLEQSDFVTLHCPRTDETLNLMGYAQFARMKPTAYFVNTSRGGTYNEADLVAALKDKRLAGAAVDVFLSEPPPTDHPLFGFDNVIVSPHIAGITHEALSNLSLYAADQWLSIFDGKVPPRLINREAWPKYSRRFEEITGLRPEALSSPAC